MTIKFPSFDPGTVGTLLDSENAKMAKAFIEAWNNVTVVIGGENKVSISDSNVVISLNRADLGGGSYTEGSAVDTVGSDGKLNAVVKHSTWATPTAYPTNVQAVATVSATRSIMNGDEVSVSNATLTNYSYLTKDEIKLHNGSTADLSILRTALTHNMGVEEWDVCDNGTAKKALFVSSDPY